MRSGDFLDFVTRPGTPRAEGHTEDTCGEPNEIELAAAHGLFYRSVSRPGGKPLIGNFHMSFIEETEGTGEVMRLRKGPSPSRYPWALGEADAYIWTFFDSLK